MAWRIDALLHEPSHPSPEPAKHRPEHHPEDWHAARTLAECLAIATWVQDHPLSDTPTSTTEPTTPLSDNPLDVADPVQMLTDDQLTQAITDISQRIDLAETEAILYGPAPGNASADTTAVDTTTWLHDELAYLNVEQQRRAQLTPEQADADDTFRTRHQNDNAAEDFPEYELDPVIDPTLGYDDLGL
ncbi:hypothetical protein [Nocardia sp. N2S4-5]|uniref:hypothetical protein n=1 Tax=Nocardia sp. N2S4-5 TaxID=3351565 RepID=UPI0037D22863